MSDDQNMDTGSKSN